MVEHPASPVFGLVSQEGFFSCRNTRHNKLKSYELKLAFMCFLRVFILFRPLVNAGIFHVRNHRYSLLEDEVAAGELGEKETVNAGQNCCDHYI